MSLGLTLQEIVDKDGGRTLPSHPTWPRVELSDVAKVQNGFAFPSSGFNHSEGMPLIRIRDVKRGRTETLFRGDYPSEYEVHNGSVVIGMDGDFNCAIWPGPPALLNQRVCRIIPKDGQVTEKYLAFVLPPYLKAINEHTSSITVKHLSSRTVERIPIPLPTIDEQKQVVDEIETQFARLDDAVAALERARARLKRYRASVLKAACEGRLVPTEAELARREGRDYEPATVLLDRIKAERETSAETKRGKVKKVPHLEMPELPGGWAWTTLASIANIKGGITKGQQRKDGEIVREVPYLRVANVQRGFLDLQEVKLIAAPEQKIQELLLRQGDVLFNEGGDRDKLGRGWIWREEISECIHQNHVFRARMVDGTVEPKYISWYGNTFGQRYFIDQGKQTTNLASINLTKLGGLPIPVPPFAEQNRIVAEVERRISVIEQMEATVETSLKRAEALRQSILRIAFSGRLSDLVF